LLDFPLPLQSAETRIPTPNSPNEPLTSFLSAELLFKKFPEILYK
jgi:hypothetical protein